MHRELERVCIIDIEQDSERIYISIIESEKVSKRLVD